MQPTPRHLAGPLTPPGPQGTRQDSSRWPALVYAGEPRINFTLGILLGHTVSLFKPPGEFRPFTLDHIKVVVGELAPLQLNLAFEFLPVAFNAIPIHRLLLPSGMSEINGEPGPGAKVPVTLGVQTSVPSREKDRGVADSCRLRPR